MDIFSAFIIPAIVGIGVGVVSGLLGIGGGTVLVPIFRLVFGMSPIMSTATSLFTIIPTSISGAIAHIRYKTCVPALGVAAGLGGACTSPLGVWLAHISPPWMVMLGAALIIAYAATHLLLSAWKMKKAQVKAVDAGSSVAEEEASDVDEPPMKLTRKQLLIGVAIGTLAGLIGGYVGVGGGFIMVPLMLSFIGISMKKASGTSLIAVMILAIPGTIEHALLGNVNFMAGLAVALGSIPGAVLGARLVRIVPEQTLRIIFGCFLIFAAFLLLVR